MSQLKRFLKMNPIRLLKKICCFEEIYTIGYRNRDGHTLLDSDRLSFDRIPYSDQYWYADPILVTYGGTDYLFMESYDMDTQLGSIACAAFDKTGKLSEPRIIIQEKYHMSFPMVFSWNDELYMIPETCGNRSVNLYRCEGDIYQWSLVKSFPVEEELVDTVAVSCREDRVELISAAQNPQDPMQNKWQKLWILRDGEDFRLEQDMAFNARDAYNYKDRMAGSLVADQGREILPTQESTVTDYGAYLYLNDFSGREITDLKILKKITVDNIRLPDVPAKEQIGVHSYGLTDRIEVVDMRYFRFSPKTRMKKIRNLGRRILCTLRCFCC